MKKILFILIAICSGCNEAKQFLPDFLTPDPTSSYIKKYIIIADYVDDDLLNNIKKIQNNCHNYPLDSCSELRLMIYLTTFQSAQKEFDITFTQAGRDNIDAFSNFVTSLEKVKVDSIGNFEDKGIVRCLSDVMSKQMTDTAVQYELFVYSSFLEMSGDPINENNMLGTTQESANFRFVTNGGKVNPMGLNAALNQIEDSTSTLYQSIIRMSAFNPKYTNIYFINKMPDFLADRDYNKYTIMKFWKDLIMKTGITPKNYSSLSDHSFFKNS